MQEKKNTFLEWVNIHKKELIIAGISITTIVAIVLGLKNRAAIESYWQSLLQLLEKDNHTNNLIAQPHVIKHSNVPSYSINNNIIPFSKSPHHVSEHIRTLPNGHNASISKLEFAKNNGIQLLPGQTIVNSYTTGGGVA